MVWREPASWQLFNKIKNNSTRLNPFTPKHSEPMEMYGIPVMALLEHKNAILVSISAVQTKVFGPCIAWHNQCWSFQEANAENCLSNKHHCNKHAYFLIESLCQSENAQFNLQQSPSALKFGAPFVTSTILCRFGSNDLSLRY